jgi:hypothetical protein
MAIAAGNEDKNAVKYRKADIYTGLFKYFNFQ